MQGQEDDAPHCSLAAICGILLSGRRLQHLVCAHEEQLRESVSYWLPDSAIFGLSLCDQLESLALTLLDEVDCIAVAGLFRGLPNLKVAVQSWSCFAFREVPGGLSAMTNLTGLHLSQMGVTDIHSALQALPATLQRLRLTETHDFNDGPVCLEDFPSDFAMLRSLTQLQLTVFQWTAGCLPTRCVSSCMPSLLLAVP